MTLLGFALSFPDFNIWSTPLLILVLQGLIFLGLLLHKYFKTRNSSYLILVFVLLIVCYEQICYTVGFMGWYHAFKNTKINYWLIPMSLGLAPLIYFYVRSITSSNFQFRKRDLWHFAPAAALILYRVGIYTYDYFQPGFHDMQNGYLKEHLDQPIIQPLLLLIEIVQMILYLTLTFQLFTKYRQKIKRYFSNTYQYELRWIFSFLLVFAVLFAYESLQEIIGALITDLSYTQRWWLNLFMAIATLYIGVRGYFTETSKLNNLNFQFNPAEDQESSLGQPEDSDSSKSQLTAVMQEQRPYLNPDLNLVDLAGLTGMNRATLSHLINSEFGMNFNDYINGFRIDAVKMQLASGQHKQLSLLGIALESGFNSKATFNRVFKKRYHVSPTSYIKDNF